jgi:hypothetical protein
MDAALPKDPNLPKVHSIIQKVFTVYETDIFLASYPKSGNTWARFLIANLISPNQVISFRNLDDFVFGWNRDPRELKTLKHPRIMKSHFRTFDNFPRFVYVVRDGRDVMVSLYNFIKAIKDSSLTFSEFLDRNLVSRQPKLGRWHEHVELAMYACSRRPPKEYLVLQYERILANPMRQARDLANFCGIEFTEEELAVAVQKCRFENLQQIERQFGPERLDASYTFFRQGTAGQWKEIFSEDDLKLFNSVAGDTMAKLGYR